MNNNNARQMTAIVPNKGSVQIKMSKLNFEDTEKNDYGGGEISDKTNALTSLSVYEKDPSTKP